MDYCANVQYIEYMLKGSKKERSENRGDPRIEVLRDRLRRFEERWIREEREAVVSTGVEKIDRLLPGGGFPRAALSEINGPLGGGRMTVAWRAAAAAVCGGEAAACVDARGWLYPPGVGFFDMDWRRLCMVRPPGGERAVWAAEQLVRSGCFKMVMIYCARRLSQVEGRRLHRAAEAGGSAVILVGIERPSRGLPIALRLHVEMNPEGEVQFCVLRARGAAPGCSGRMAWRMLLGLAESGLSEREDNRCAGEG